MPTALRPHLSHDNGFRERRRLLRGLLHLDGTAAHALPGLQPVLHRHYLDRQNVRNQIAATGRPANAFCCRRRLDLAAVNGF